MKIVMRHFLKLLLSNTVAARRNDAVGIDRRLDPAAKVPEARNCLLHVKVVVVDGSAPDENATVRDRLGHFSVAGIRALALVLIIAVENKNMETARKAWSACVHDHVVMAMLLEDPAAQRLEFVSDLAVH